jgi:hypothetical protein
MNTPTRLNSPIDRQTLGAMSVDKFAGLTFQSYADATEFAKTVTNARYGLPEHLRNNPADCLILCTQALRWRLEPTWVMQQSYVAQKGGIIAFNSFLFSAVLNASGLLTTRPRFTFVGQNDQRICTVSAVFKGETEPHTYTTPPLKVCKRNSPLWASDPDQQLSYYAIRAFARRYVPELLGGVYDREEADEIAAKDAPPPKTIRTIAEGLDELVAKKGSVADVTDDEFLKVLAVKRDQLKAAGLEDEDIEEVIEDMGEDGDGEFDDAPPEKRP